MGIQIVTDSTTEISQSEAKKLGIAVVPLKSLFGEKEYLDGIDMSPEEFYVKLAESKELPTTSQPTPFDFEQVFR
jgi:DegV family protein with EDD domain